VWVVRHAPRSCADTRLAGREWSLPVSRSYLERNQSAIRFRPCERRAEGAALLWRSKVPTCILDGRQYLPVVGAGLLAALNEDEAMDATKIQDYARQLLEAHGAKAIAEAAQKAAACEKAGDKQRAETWRRVEAALLLMHGPRQS